VTMKNGVFWDVTSCRNWCCSVLQLLFTSDVVPSSSTLVTLMMEEIRSFETSVLTRATKRNIPEDYIRPRKLFRISVSIGPMLAHDQQERECIQPWQNDRKWSAPGTEVRVLYSSKRIKRLRVNPCGFMEIYPFRLTKADDSLNGNPSGYVMFWQQRASSFGQGKGKPRCAVSAHNRNSLSYGSGWNMPLLQEPAGVEGCEMGV
jgi:hypothetical protein